MANRPSESHLAYVRNSRGELERNLAYIPRTGGKHRAPVGLRPRNDASRPLKRMSAFELGAELADLGSERVNTAMDMAMFCHRGQVRKENRGGKLVQDDYVIHPLRNANRIVRWGGDEDKVIVTLLHDTVEDSPDKVCEFTGEDDPYKGITKVFGDRVARGVKGMSNDPDSDYREHAREASAENEDVLWSKSADLKDNAGSLGYMAAGSKRDRLVNKYSPLVDDLIHIANDRHGTEKVVSALTEVQGLLSRLRTR